MVEMDGTLPSEAVTAWPASTGGATAETAAADEFVVRCLRPPWDLLLHFRLGIFAMADGDWKEMMWIINIWNIVNGMWGWCGGGAHLEAHAKLCQEKIFRESLGSDTKSQYHSNRIKMTQQ